MNTHKKTHARILFVLFCLLAFFLSGQAQAREIQPIPMETPRTIQKQQKALRPGTNIPKDMIKVRLIQAIITEVRINTRPNGNWFWKVKVRNTGNAVINPGELSVQTVQRTNNPSASLLTTGGRQVMQPIQPGQIAEVTGNWTRCSQIYEFKATLRNLVTNKDIHTKKINPVPRISLVEVKPVNIRWFDQEKKWDADIINTSGYTLKITAQGSLQKGFNKQAVGGQVLTIPSGSTVKTMKFSAPQAENGDVLFVHLYQSLNEGYCKEKGGIGGWGINIPNSRYNIP